jgi:hypothetical protein
MADTTGALDQLADDLTADEVAALEADIDRRLAELMPDRFARRSVSQPEPQPEQPEVVVKVAPAPPDEAVAGLLGGLMPVVYIEAMRSFEQARQSGTVEMRDVHISQGYKLAKALAMLTAALARHNGKNQRMVIEHHVRRGRDV